MSYKVELKYVHFINGLTIPTKQIANISEQTYDKL